MSETPSSAVGLIPSGAPIELVGGLGRMQTDINNWLWDAIMEAADGGPPALAALLRQVHIATEALKDAYNAIEGVLADSLPGGFLTIDGLGTFERREGAKRTKWDRDAAARDVVGRILEQTTPDENGEAVSWSEEAREAILGCAAALGVAFRFEPRAGSTKAGTGLRAFGLSPDNYCETEPGRTRVVATWADLPNGEEGE